MFKIFGLKSTLLETINSLEDDLSSERQKNEIYKKDMSILIDTIKELKNKIIDLENNVELLRNNVPELKEKKTRTKKTATKKSSVKKTTTRRKSTKKEVIPSDQTNK